MKRTAFMLLCVLFLTIPAYPVEKKDAPGCKDHPLFPTRMPDYRIEKCETKEFGFIDFLTRKGPRMTVEGKTISITYAVDDRKNDRSGIEVVRNYANALQKIGGKIQASDPQRWVNGSVVVNGKEIWFQAEKGNSLIWLKIVEKQAMNQTIVADAASLGNDLKTNGHAAVYGVLFDTGKATIRPESAQAIGEIAKLLKADPGLKLFVVGHTDNVGGVDSNIRLSQARAGAVLQVLVREHGIAPDRLLAHGCGQFAPVTTNETEVGRVKNRRVELVKQ